MSQAATQQVSIGAQTATAKPKPKLPAYERVPDGNGTREIVRTWLTDPKTGATVVPSANASAGVGKGQKDFSGLTQSGWNPLTPSPVVEDPSIEDGTGGTIVYPPGCPPGTPLNPAFAGNAETKVAEVPTGYTQPTPDFQAEPIEQAVEVINNDAASSARLNAPTSIAVPQYAVLDGSAATHQYIMLEGRPVLLDSVIGALKGATLGPSMSNANPPSQPALLAAKPVQLQPQWAKAVGPTPSTSTSAPEPTTAPDPTVKVNFHRPGFKIPAFYHEVLAIPDFNGLMLVVDTQSTKVNVPELEAGAAEPLILSWEGQDEPIPCAFFGWQFLVQNRYLVSLLMVMQPKEPTET